MQNKQCHLMKCWWNNEESLGPDMFSIENSDEWSNQNYAVMNTHV